MFGQNNSFGGGSTFGAANNQPKPAFGGFGTTTSQPSGGGFGGGGLFGQNTNTSTGGGKNKIIFLFSLTLQLFRTFWTADSNFVIWTDELCLRSTNSHKHFWPKLQHLIWSPLSLQASRNNGLWRSDNPT